MDAVTKDASVVGDWTADENGVSNSSSQYLDAVAHVARLIRSDAHTLLTGDTDKTARLIVSNLAHRFGLSPQKGD